MDLTQQFCLKWNNHQKNLLTVFEDLLNQGAFVDVTLACDGIQLKAHKMVLSACSPYFRSLLFDTPDRHPIVFLKDVNCSEMKALLEFMYHGEVSIDRENLTSFLRVAESLQIKGLAEVLSEHRDNHHHLENFNYKNQTKSRPTFSDDLEMELMMGQKAGVLTSKQVTSPPPPLQMFHGQKRKRVRPRRLSGTGAILMVAEKLGKIKSGEWIMDNPEVNMVNCLASDSFLTSVIIFQDEEDKSAVVVPKGL